MEKTMLWFGLMVNEGSEVVSREIHGPYEDTDALADAIDERVEEEEREGRDPVVFPFELCTDDVPEVVEYDSTRVD